MRTQRTYIERIVVTGKMTDVDTARERCYQQGFRIMRSGPKRLTALQVDVSRFHIEAEREMWVCPQCGRIGAAARCSACVGS